MLRPNSGPVYGKVDIYHALQASLIPTLPTIGRVMRFARNGLKLANLARLVGFDAECRIELIGTSLVDHLELGRFRARH